MNKNQFLQETENIDYNHEVILIKVKNLIEQSDTSLDYIKRAYEFVRDEIPHSWDIQAETVSRKASEVLLNNTGICWTKSCLLAALLRANGIPSGISYQLLTRADEDASEGYIIHALNTVYIEEIDYRDNHSDLDERLVDVLKNSRNVLEVTTVFRL